MNYAVTHLTVELERAPIVIDEKKPRFGWRIESDGKNVLQTGYRVVVEGMWDSGYVAGGETQWIEYAGKQLLPRTEYRWTATSYYEGGY